MTNPMTTKELAALAELSRYRPNFYGVMLDDPTGPYIHYDAASETILALTARVETLTSALTDLSFYEEWMDGYPDDVMCHSYKRLTFGQIRKARAALNAKDVTP